MKGVVLAGGLGTRLRPLTSVTNKHLLPVYDQPMIYYPIQTLVNAGITDIMIVTGGKSEALSLVEHFCAGQPVCVVLGDNIIEGNIGAAVRAYQDQGRGAKIIL